MIELQSLVGYILFAALLIALLVIIGRFFVS